MVNAPPPFVGPKWAELPSNYFAVQRVSCQPDLVVATHFLVFCCVLKIYVLPFIAIFLQELTIVNTGKRDSVKVEGA
jgi:hypothetical protein